MVASISLATVGVLGMTHFLTPALLLVIVGVAALTGPLSNAGTRSLYPVMVPRALWDRANAFDSGAYVIAQLLGPPIAGLLVATRGGAVALLCDAALYAAGFVAMTRLPEPQLARAGHGHLLAEALGALLYVVRNRTLAVLALTVSLFNAGFGIVMIALPVLVFSRLHGGDTEVGVLLAVMAVGGIVAGFASGRIDSDGREWLLIALGSLGTALAFLALAVADSAPVVALALLLVGLSNGPLDIGLFSLRQRATDPLWMGRAFAVSASMNFAGYPLGSAIGGPIVERSVTGAAAAAGVAALLAAVGATCALPRGRRPRA